VIFRGLLRTRRTVKPLIAAIEGSCIAGGVEILQATDIRVAAEGSKLGVSEVRWGCFPRAAARHACRVRSRSRARWRCC